MYEYIHDVKEMTQKHTDYPLKKPLFLSPFPEVATVLGSRFGGCLFSALSMHVCAHTHI